ncbi:Serine/arginine repetitive matrix protein 1 [Pseudolycoriella hygida]|uniref:Serine/arginine repetitive matrix protein 1 n=1 Tax=Pseudolycoriella hygida TaxID=35572 RepID=A0A9Q0N7C2_9DIPT|nr:Serine/arginine repetitive matrix protein 1 [Pseudolycoriella hygida]
METNQQEDTQFSDIEKKLLKKMEFGDCLNQRVDMTKVKLDELRPWIDKKITDILHGDDDIMVYFIYNHLEEKKYPCPKKLQLNLNGFVKAENARLFVDELWKLLISAQESDTGVPTEFIQQFNRSLNFPG